MKPTSALKRAAATVGGAYVGSKLVPHLTKNKLGGRQLKENVDIVKETFLSKIFFFDHRKHFLQLSQRPFAKHSKYQDQYRLLQ